jgi:hypothetical protein
MTSSLARNEADLCNDIRFLINGKPYITLRLMCSPCIMINIPGSQLNILFLKFSENMKESYPSNQKFKSLRCI